MYTVYCYDPSQHKWIILPPLPVRYFGLGQVNSKLVAVGGVKNGKAPSNDVYTLYDDGSRKWKQKIPPMPTARYAPGVLSLQSALVVAGGFTSLSYTAAVEIFKPDTSQWYKTDLLPTVCCNISKAKTQTSFSPPQSIMYTAVLYQLYKKLVSRLAMDYNYYTAN